MIVLKIINIFLALTFVRFAYWQHNDLDYIIWMLTYGAAFGICVAGAFGKLKPVIPIIGLAVFLPWSAYLYIPLKERGIQIEEWRESFGLLICAAAMANRLAISHFSKEKQDPSDEELRKAATSA
ncbi:MAG: hypothetical protein O3B01_25245 [Planctomycetota bacterium]|nr:hypothetical protein [Planctomycetota bacterium]MDA1141883.1 hypothetical protein [Planctomycetota bacterium]